MPPASPSAVEGADLRLVTFNTWKGDGAYGRRLPAMAAYLEALQPDIVALQEVLIAPELGHDTAAYLASALGMKVAAVPLRRKRRDIEGRTVDSWSGLAVLSRRPVSRSKTILLPTDPRDGERAALAVEIDGLAVICLHLTHLQDAGDLRNRQMAAVFEAARENAGMLIAGDFNEVAEALPLEGTGFSDCRVSLGLPPVPTLVGGGRSDCIDLVLHRQGAGPRPVGWFTAECDRQEPPSDHLAVAVDLS